MLRTPALVRASLTANVTRAAPRQGLLATSNACMQQRQAHAISNPQLAGLERRWESMSPQEQATLWMQLRDRMKVDWHELTQAEKKAAYWVAFGPHGPRAEPEKGAGSYIIYNTTLCLIVSGVIFGAIRYFARPAPSTMNKEWQEATEAYLKELNVEPITGISNPNFKGNFSVQSASKDA